MRTKIVIVVFLILVLVGITWLAFEWGYPKAQAGSIPAPPLRATCGPCPDSLGSWVRVQSYLSWSGCVDAACWAVWASQGPNALMENTGHRCRLDHSGDPDNLCNPVPSTIPPDTIFDPRDRCEGVPARGTWYHNAFARPSWVVDTFDPAGPIVYCVWQMDLSKQYWNFAEDDECEICVAPTSAPTTPGETPTPLPTECYVTPMINPTNPPVTPTPFVPEKPTFRPMAYVHSRYDPKHGVYIAGPTIYWNWQEYLHTSLSAEVDEPHQAGCSVSTEVKSFWFEGSVFRNRRGEYVDQPVCPVDGSGRGCRWRPVYSGPVGRYVNPVLKPTEEHPEWIHLIWTLGAPQPDLPEGYWNFYPVGPVNVEIRYRVLAVTTYFCEGFTYVAPWVSDTLALQLKQLHPVRFSR